MPNTKSRRLELRTDESTDALITEAAELLHVTKSAFVADAARQAAQKVVSRADMTLMAPEVFDLMMASLDTPDESAELAALARLPRLIGRRANWLTMSRSWPPGTTWGLLTAVSPHTING